MAAQARPPDGAASQGAALPSDVDTVIFVDVDGVLNVGAAERGKSPTLFNDSNLRLAQSLWTKREGHKERHLVESLMAISRKRLDGESEALVSLVAKTPSYVSDILVGRLAEILEVAGPRSLTVLASTWQSARHKQRLQDLESRLARWLGREFSFQATTGSSEESTPDGRLRAIGNCMAELTSRGGVAAAAAEAGRLRVLVLEDFFITSLTGAWSLDGRPMDSPGAVEEYVAAAAGAGLAAGGGSRVRSPTAAQVRLIHTYSEWSTADGMLVRCGVGISQADVQRSKEFLAPGVDENGERKAHAPKLENEVFGLRCTGPTWLCSMQPLGPAACSKPTSHPSWSSEDHDPLRLAPL